MEVLLYYSSLENFHLQYILKCNRVGHLQAGEWHVIRANWLTVAGLADAVVMRTMVLFKVCFFAEGSNEEMVK